MVSDHRISSSTGSSAASFKARKISGEALEFQPPQPVPLSSSPSWECSRIHRSPSYSHCKGPPFFLLLLQGAKGNHNGFQFSKIPDHNHKCLEDNVGFWPCDKNLPCGKRPQKDWPSAYTEKRKKHRVGQTPVSILKTKSPHTVDSLGSIFPEFSCAHKAKYLSKHKIFFFFKGLDYTDAVTNAFFFFIL